MFNLDSLDDFNLLRETSSIEFKLAGGRDGKGELPNDFWPTYSAMANTDGGVVVLGVRERKGRFELEGVGNIEKLKADQVFDPYLRSSSIGLEDSSVGLTVSSIGLERSSSVLSTSSLVLSDSFSVLE